MADLKISQLTSATLPLAGTEVLPIVQSSTTKKVATDDLTVKNVRSNATTGILQVAGPSAASTRTMTVPDANFTAARIDAAQSFTGDQTLSTGNLVIGTAGKGIDFSADPSAPGMTSELLDDYEEGTWTPSLGGTAVYDIQGGNYVKIGRFVYVYCAIRPTTLGTGSAVTISGLPFTCADSSTGISVGYFDTSATNCNTIFGVVSGTTVTLYPRNSIGAAVDTSAGSFFQNNARIQFSTVYEV